MMLRISEAAELTGRSRQTLVNWIENGVLPAKKINGTYYVSKAVIESLQSDLEDLDLAKASVEAAKEEYRKQKESYDAQLQSMRFEHDKNRYLSICVNSGLRTRFFANIVRMLELAGEIGYAEAEVLIDVLDGKDLAEIAAKHKTSRERIRKLAERAIRKSENLQQLTYKLNCLEDYETRNSALENELNVTKKLVFKRSASVIDRTLNENEKRVMRMDKDELNKLLAQKLTNCDLSVRVLTCLYAFRNLKGERTPIETVADLCRISKKEFLMQRNAGKKTSQEIENFLTSQGLGWDIDIDKILEVKL